MSEETIMEDEALKARIREKEESRKRDLERLRTGEVTPEELQRENSMFPEGWIKENFTLDWDAIGRSDGQLKGPST